MNVLGRKLAKWLVRPFRSHLEARVGPFRKLLRVHQHRTADRTIRQALEAIHRRIGSARHRDTCAGGLGPVFVLSAGWRSGSTLAQRLICSAGTILVWGEPYDRCDIIRSLARSISEINEAYPPEGFLATSKMSQGAGGSPPLAERWIANLYPDLTDLQAAHRAFFQTLFAAPARARGYSRWGLKDVRLGVEHAAYIKWLFPNARFLFVYRNPYDAYRSFRPHRGWYDRFPDRPVLTPVQFGQHWKRLCEGFVCGWESVDGLLLSYEGLTQDQASIDRLEDYLHLTLNREVLRRRVGSTNELTMEKVPGYEIRAVKRAVEPLASSLGYRMPQAGNR